MCVGASSTSSQEPVHGRGSVDLLGGDLDGWLRFFSQGLRIWTRVTDWSLGLGVGHENAKGTFTSNCYRDQSEDSAGKS
jgi:hypothetical protein